VIDSRRNRAFHYAVLASLALHALLLFGVPDLLVDSARRAASLPPQIIARLMAPEPPAAPPTPPAPVVPEEPPQPKVPPKQAAKKPAPPPPLAATPAPQLPVVPAPQALPAPAAPPEAPAAPPVAAAPAPQAEAQPAPAQVQPAPQAGAPSTSATEAMTRDQYRVALMEEAARYARRRFPPKGYPPLAQDNSWEGSLKLGIAVNADGRASVSLKASSGHEVLDRHALDTFRQAARTVPVPQALRGRDFALEVSAVYRLED
jgi:protein TonB